jgi:inorganic pyrophosphatase
MLFNYGCIPQTWEDPHKRHEMTGTLGDNDPIDVVDIGSKMWTCGSLVAVKVLGVLGMIDSGETDWKVRSPLRSGAEHLSAAAVAICSSSTATSCGDGQRCVTWRRAG